MFSSRIPLGELTILCRILRHNLGAGLSVLEVFRQQAKRGSTAVRPIAGRFAERLQTGDSLVTAFEKERDRFPPLFLSMVRVAEETGHMPEIFGELEKYYSLEQRLRRQFISQSVLPVLQFFFAIFIIAGLIWVLGAISDARATKPPALFGLSGTKGSLMFLTTVLGTLTVLFLTYRLMQNQLRNRASVEALLLRIPVLGPCLEAIAMSRLCLAMQLTLDSGMPIMAAMRLSLAATGNNAFTMYAADVALALKKGIPLTDALVLVRPLPSLFVDLVATAEEAGSVPEMMRHQAEFYREESSRRLKALTSAASMGLWMVYAACIIYAIFQIAGIYLSALDKV